MTTNRGQSLLETLLTLGIIALLSVLAYPVLGEAKLRVKEAQSKSNLSQLHKAIVLYQMDHDGIGNYGSVSEMGLPSDFGGWQLKNYPRLVPPLAPDPNSPMIGLVYYSLFNPGDNVLPNWKNYSSEMKDDAVLLIDPFFKSDPFPLEQETKFSRRFLYLTLGGKVSWRWVKNDWQSRLSWLGRK